MPIVMCFNPGSNSLKFDLVEVHESQAVASQGTRLASGTVDNIGKDTTLELTLLGREPIRNELSAGDMGDAVRHALKALVEAETPKASLCAIRVVHGGDVFRTAVELTDDVLREIKARSELAPLHNPNAVKIVHALREEQTDLRLFACFDTAFHHTLPEVAWRYPIEKECADRLGIRKFGFHGISHRYQLEQYCSLTQTALSDANIVTSHLESGSSLCAISCGESVETSMGFTPLEGLMMGTRSGSIDPAILPFLMKHEALNAEEALKLLEKDSGLKGVSGKSLDTRILRKEENGRSRLALEMYAYRARAMFGAYLAILGNAKAIVFGGGIGENTPEVRSSVLDGLAGFGVEYDRSKNESVRSGDVRISTNTSSLDVWVLHADEGMQLAHEAMQTMAERGHRCH